MTLRQFFFTMTLLICACHSYSQEQAAATNKKNTDKTPLSQRLNEDRPTVTMEQKDVSLKEIIRQFELQTAYSFIYNETIDLNQKKTVIVRQQPPEAALNLIFDKTGIDWKIRNRYVTLTNKKTSAVAQKATVSGTVADMESSEVLIGANVYDIRSGIGTATNEFGFFSLTLPAGEAELRFSYTGYTPEMRKIDLTRNQVLPIRLKTNTQLEEVVVTGTENSESGIRATHMGAFHMPIHLLTATPVLLGEADVMKALQMLPGVQAGTQGSAGVYVRGGGPDENLILLDGIPIYNVDHLFGFFSVFTPEAVKKVTLFKSSFPARFGGRLSSVIDVRTNDGDMYNYHGSFSIGLLSSKLQFEGPLIKGRTSFNISARRSYFDLLAKPFMNDDKTTLYFYDLNAKINHQFTDKSRLFLSFYNGHDKYGIESKEKSSDYTEKEKRNYVWGNTLLSGRWNYIFSPKLFSNTTVAYTNYHYRNEGEMYHAFVEEKTDVMRSSRTHSGIKDIAGKMDFDYFPSPKHHVKFGAGYLYHTFKPEVQIVRIKENADGTTTNDAFNSQKNAHVYANELSVYAEDDVRLTPRLNVNAGLHFSLFNVKNTSYTSLQPRLSARYQLSENVALKAAYTQMNQYIHLLSDYNLTLPSDLWVPTTDRIKPMRAHQYSLGAYYTGVKGWEFSVETYYKDMRNVLEYKDGASYLGSSYDWDEKVEMGRGRSYGIELMAQKTTGKTTGWVAYTLARSERKFDADGINRGEWFPYRYDRRHHINLTANHKLSDRIDISASWEFFTGGVFTVSEEMTSYISPQYTAAHFFQNGYYHAHVLNGVTGTTTWITQYIKNRNNYRLPASHCLNLGIHFHKQKKHGERIWTFGIYNTYNALNPQFIYKSFAYDYQRENPDRSVLKKVTLFPIIPSATYTYKF